MAPPPSETQEIEQAFHAALVKIGASTVAESLTLWDELPPGSDVRAARAWLAKAVALVMGRRRQGRDLARSYYRLVRALHTGTTTPDPVHPDLAETTLTELRQDFAERTGYTPPSSSTPTGTTPAPQEGATGNPGPVDNTEEGDGSDDEADRILIEEIKGLEAEAERIERAAEEEARTALAALGAENQRKRVEAINRRQQADEVDRLEALAHKEAGARQAASAARLAQNGARSEVWSTASKDGRAIGYVRLSRTGTPCGWCAMLISRGPVYRSEESATYKGAASYDDGDKYHDNCNCYAMPIFTREQFDNSDLFALNREYAEQWPRVTRGLSGKAALSAWRYFIRSQARPQAGRASSSSVQEA